MALTQRLRYVNTASSAGGNGTTNLTSGATRAYPSLQAAITAEVIAGADLVALDNYITIYCSGTAADTTAVTITGFTTNASHYIEIAPGTSDAHAGSWDASKYRLEVGGVGVILIQQSHVTLWGLQIKSTAVDPDDGRGVYLSTGVANGTILVRQCIIRYASSGTPTTSANNHGIRANTSETSYTLRLVNNLVYDFRSDGVFLNPQTLNETCVVYNNTVCDCGGHGLLLTGNSSGEKLYCKDNLIQNCTATDFTLDGSAWGGAYTTSKNITEDASSPDGATYQSKVVQFADEPADDFHLSGADTVAKDQGDDLSADAIYAFNTDINGTTRSAPWSIGADGGAASGGGSPGTGIGFGWQSFNGGFQ